MTSTRYRASHQGLGKDEFVKAWGKEPFPLYVAAVEGVAVSLYRLDPVTE
jgi:hypothetical protein